MCFELKAFLGFGFDCQSELFVATQDGPSAGVAVLLALASLVLNRPDVLGYLKRLEEFHRN